jgi:hypothetical protein
MKRLFYLAVGAGVGVAAVRRVSRTAQKLKPANLAGSAGGVVTGIGSSIRSFIDDVKIGMAEREIELTDALTAEAPPPAHSNGHATRGRSTQ